MGTLGAFWSYENMGIHDLAANDFIKEVLLSAPYMIGKAQVSPTMNLNMKNESSLKEEVKRLRHNNAELRAELERLKQENIELKSALSKLQIKNKSQ
ncbi:pantothenate kinase 1-like [Dendrobium catenatum]|uniref:Uncharacterized protein n=1 Tax=Dendrobium catenatum TaxID=906689 RepID=A0A2I0VA91_9ASPA|nr:pantothenate kinase 1-like [Dendrobium catenatum]PKU60328.1 hypothetical protein MA16_Dca028659 [Dendrobium catenatum]